MAQPKPNWEERPPRPDIHILGDQTDLEASEPFFSRLSIENLPPKGTRRVPPASKPEPAQNVTPDVQPRENYDPLDDYEPLPGDPTASSPDPLPTSTSEYTYRPPTERRPRPPARMMAESKTAYAADSAPVASDFEEALYEEPTRVVTPRRRATAVAGGNRGQSLPFSRGVIGLLVLGVLAVLILAFVVFRSPATVAPFEVGLNLTRRAEVTVQTRLGQADFDRLAKPIETEFSYEGSYNATATIQVPDGRASGPIRLLNSSTGAITIAAGTQVATVNGVGYRLAGAVTVPGADLGAARFGSAGATVTADRPGPVGNNGGLGTFTLPSGVRVTGAGPIQGGTSRAARAASPGDLEALKRQLNDPATLTARAKDAVTAKVPAGFITAGEPEILDPRITIAQAPDTEVTTPDGKFVGKLTARVRLLSFDPAQVLNAAAASPGDPAAPKIPAQFQLTPGSDPEVVVNNFALPPPPPPGPASLKLLKADLPARSLDVTYTRLYPPEGSEGLAAALKSWVGRRTDFDRLLQMLRARPDLADVTLNLNPGQSLPPPGDDRSIKLTVSYK